MHMTRLDKIIDGRERHKTLKSENKAMISHHQQYCSCLDTSV